jgi:hypothetical protein
MAAAWLGLAMTPGPAAPQPLPPIAAPPPGIAAAPPEGGGGPASPQAGGARGRYELSLVPGSRLGQADFVPFALLLDTATGQTWLLPPLQLGAQQTMVWTPVPFLSAAGGTSTSPAPR